MSLQERFPIGPLILFVGLMAIPGRGEIQKSEGRLFRGEKRIPAVDMPSDPHSDALGFIVTHVDSP